MQAKGQAAKLARLNSLRDTVETLRATVEGDKAEFQTSMLASVRLQAKLIAKAIDDELDNRPIDPKTIKALVETLATFEAMEQKLSMRAGPGSLKPTAAKTPKAGSFVPPPPADDPDPQS